jgi:putative aldouronate transport system substrate-binding protein
MKTRPISIVLVLLLVLTMLASCSGGDKNNPVDKPTSTPTASTSGDSAATDPPTASDVPEYMNEVGLPIAKELTTFTVFMQRDEADGRWEDLETMQWLEGITNVHFEYESVPTAEEYKDKLNLMFVGGTYPDVLMPRGSIDWQNEEAFAKEKYVIDLKPLIERWMPNCQEVMETNPQLKAGQTAADGGMYGLPFLYQGKGGNPHLWYMEPYWMRAAGYTDVPNTVDEMKKFMYDIKAVMDSGDYLRPEEGMYVLGYNSATGMSTMTNVMLTAYTGAIASIDSPWAAPDNKTVQFLVEHPGYKETVKFFRDIYRDGLVDPDVFTMDGATFNARKTECKYAMFTGSSSALNPEKIRDTPPAKEGDGYACMAIRPLTSQWNDKPLVNFETEGNIDWSMITDKCEKPEIMARWFDIFYNMHFDVKDKNVPNPFTFYLGFYGDHWTYTGENDKFWTFLPTRKDGLKNEDGTPAIIDWTYSRQFLVPGWSLPCGFYSENAFSVGNERFVGKQITTAANVYPYCTTDTQISSLARMTQEETDAVATKLTELKAYLGEQFGLFMSGQKDIDAEWDNFVAECNRLGAKEITAVYQSVYDRWNATLQK